MDGTHEPVDHENAYAGLLGGDDSQWAFGTDFEDPLAGVEVTLPDGVAAEDLAAYAVMLADDALVMAQRLSEWCSRAPDLEEDIALANVALDLLGQARLLLARAAAADPSCVPVLPEGSPVPPEDALAFFRDDRAYLNVRLVELDNGDFARTVVRLLVFSTWRLALLEPLRSSRDHVLAAVAHKGVKELTYHRDYAARWFLTLARGTEESRRRLLAGLDMVWPWTAELLLTHPVEARVAGCGIGIDPSAVATEVDSVLDQVLSLSGIDRPADASSLSPGPGAPVPGETGRDGVHTEALGALLSEMQSVARDHATGSW